MYTHTHTHIFVCPCKYIDIEGSWFRIWLCRSCFYCY